MEKLSSGIASVSYVASKDEYIMKQNQKTLHVFDGNFRFKRTIALNASLKQNDSYTGQAIYADGEYIYGVYINAKTNPYKNYISVFDYNTGKFVRTINLGNKVTKKYSKVEVESLTSIGNNFYANANISGGSFAIFQLKLTQ